MNRDLYQISDTLKETEFSIEDLDRNQAYVLPKNYEVDLKQMRFPIMRCEDHENRKGVMVHLRVKESKRKKFDALWKKFFKTPPIYDEVLMFFKMKHFWIAYNPNIKIMEPYNETVSRWDNKCLGWSRHQFEPVWAVVHDAVNGTDDFLELAK